MGALIIVESWVLALTTSTASAQGLSAPATHVRPMGVCACLSRPGAQAAWLIGETTVGQAQPFVFTSAGLGPFIDDSRRQDDEDRERRREEKLRQDTQREEELREHYRNYGYTSPPFLYADPRLGPYSRDPQTGCYYNYGTRYYYNPDTGQYYDADKNNNSLRVQVER